MVHLFTTRRCERPLQGERCRRKEITATAQPQWTGVTVTTSQTNVTGNVYVPPATETYGYDLDGNLTSDGRWTYNWDAENRLTNIVARTTTGPQLCIKFEYDWQGRRIHKQVWTNTNGTGTASIDQRYLYDGWNVIAVLDTANTLKQSYTWGTDLSGSKQGAGGVGGLLWIYDSSTSARYFASYDGNGNVSGLVKSTDGTVSAQYDYGPFGEVIRQTGTMATNNPFRFSTKFADNETDLLYYGYRYYNPSTGRWLSKDPIEEKGGLNLYDFSANDGVNHCDYFGWTWNFKINDTGYHDPIPGVSWNGRKYFTTGLTTLTKWQVSVRLVPCPCGYKLRSDGDGAADFWWSTPQAIFHELHHAILWESGFTDTEWFAFQYELGCYSRAKAQCYQRAVLAASAYYAARASRENAEYDMAEYGGGDDLCDRTYKEENAKWNLDQILAQCASIQ